MEELDHFQQILCTISMLLIKVENGRLYSQVKTEMNKPLSFDNQPCRNLEKWMATHTSILAWRSPWTEEPGGLPSTGSQRAGHDWATQQKRQQSWAPDHLLLSSASFTCMLPAWSLKTAEFAVPKWSRNKNRIHPLL